MKTLLIDIVIVPRVGSWAEFERFIRERKGGDR